MKPSHAILAIIERETGDNFAHAANAMNLIECHELFEAIRIEAPMDARLDAAKHLLDAAAEDQDNDSMAGRWDVFVTAAAYLLIEHVANDRRNQERERDATGDARVTSRRYSRPVGIRRDNDLPPHHTIME